MLGRPRSLGPVSKDKGGMTGIGLQQDEGGTGHVVVAYVQSDSPFAKTLKKDDEILEVNGVKVTHAKQASQAMIDAAPELSILVSAHSLKLTSVTGPKSNSSSACVCAQVQTPSEMIGIVSGKGSKKR